MTSAGITRPRPLMTANWAAWVRAAPSESGNQVTGATTPVSRKARLDVSESRGLADTLPDGMGWGQPWARRGLFGWSKQGRRTRSNMDGRRWERWVYSTARWRW